MKDDVLRMFVSETSLNVRLMGRLPDAAALRNVGMNCDALTTIVTGRYQCMQHRCPVHRAFDTLNTGDVFL